MAANRFGIDLGEIYRTKSALEGSRSRNKYNQLLLSEKEREISERPEKLRVAEERKNKLLGLREQAAGGDADASRQLLALDPEGGEQFLSALGDMDERQRDKVKATVDEIGKASAYVLQGKTPEEQARRYEMMRSSVNPEVAKTLPEQYDPAFMELSLSKATAMDKLLVAPTVRTEGGEHVKYRLGRETGRTAIPKKGTGEAGAGGIKSADESLMYRQAAELLGGVFNQSGELTMLDLDSRNKAQAVATEASLLFAGGGFTRSQAVQQAAEKFGISLQKPAANDPTDPNSIRQFLLK